MLQLWCVELEGFLSNGRLEQYIEKLAVIFIGLVDLSCLLLHSQELKLHSLLLPLKLSPYEVFVDMQVLLLQALVG